MGRVDDMPSFAQQRHRLGTVVYGNIEGGIGFQVGYLAGISGAAPDHTFKVAVEYEF